MARIESQYKGLDTILIKDFLEKQTICTDVEMAVTSLCEKLLKGADDGFKTGATFTWKFNGPHNHISTFLAHEIVNVFTLLNTEISSWQYLTLLTKNEIAEIYGLWVCRRIKPIIDTLRERTKCEVILARNFDQVCIDVLWKPMSK